MSVTISLTYTYLYDVLINLRHVCRFYYIVVVCGNHRGHCPKEEHDVHHAVLCLRSIVFTVSQKIHDINIVVADLFADVDARH